MALQDDRYGQTGELQDAAQTPAIPAVKPLVPKSPVATAPLALPAGGGQATTQGAAPPPVADPLAFAPPTTPNTNPAVAGAGTLPGAAPAPAAQPSYKLPDGNWDVSTQAGMDAMQQDRAAKENSGYYAPEGGYYQPGGFGNTGFFNQAAISGRESAAAATPEQRQAQFDALKAKYAGKLEQGNSGERLAFDAPIEDQNNYDYLQQLLNAQKYAPENLQFLTSKSQIHGTPTQESEAPGFFARYGINDPNHVSPYEQSQAGLTAQGNANSGYSTIQGGQTFTDPTKGQSAFDAINKQIAAGGPSLFTSKQAGGTINPDALNQLKTGTSDASGQSRVYTDAQIKNSGGTAGGSPLPSSSQGGQAGSVPGGGQRPLLPGGTASDAGGGSPNNPLSAAIGGPEATGGRGLGYSANNIDPNNALANQVITPGAGVDRYQQAKDALENYRKGTEGSYKADSDTIAANSFGAGRGVSGQNRTRQGDLALARASDLNTKGFGFLNDALTGSIGDAYNNIGIAQQQQGYQKGLSDTAFQQEKERALLEDQLVNSDFGRNLSRETAGYANSPEQWDALLSSNFGNQAGAAGAASTAALQGSGRGGNQGLTADDIYRILDQQNRRPVQAGDETYDTGDRGEIQ